MKRALLLLALTLAWTGCGPPCSPPGDLSVSLLEQSEQTRSLPVLASGATRMLDTAVPDANGALTLRLAMLNAGKITVDAMKVAISVAGAAPVDADVVRVEQNGRVLQPGDQADNQRDFQIYWRAKDLALPEGAAFTARVTMPWRYETCGTQTGEAQLDVAGTVEPASQAEHFSLQSAQAAPPSPGQGAKAKLGLQNTAGGTLAGLAGISLTVTTFKPGELAPQAFGKVGGEGLALQSGGAPADTLAAGDALDVFTSPSPSQPGAQYDYAGQAEGSGGQRALVTVILQSAPQASPGTVSQDAVSALVELP